MDAPKTPRTHSCVQKEKEKEKNEVALTEKKLLRNKPDANYNIYIPV